MEIAEFWVNKYGKDIGCYTYSPADNIVQNLYYHKSNLLYYDQDGPPPPLAQDIIATVMVGGPLMSFYHLCGRIFNEPDMVHALKMKAFL